MSAFYGPEMLKAYETNTYQRSVDNSVVKNINLID